MFGAATEIAARSKLGDEKRLLEIISQNKARLQTRFLTAGHQVAVTRAMSYSNSAYRFKDMTEGIAYYDITKKLEENFDDCKGYLIQILEYLARKIFTYENLLISYTGSPDMDMRLQREVFAFMDTLFDKESADKVVTAEALDWAAKLTRGAEPSRNEGFTCASKVQYVARVGNFLDAGLSYTGAMNILRPILSYDYLWNNVRVQGGAYGCMGEFLMNAQGEDVVAGVRTPQKIDQLKEIMPEVYNQFLDICDTLEKHYHDMQDMEFTIEDKHLYMFIGRERELLSLSKLYNSDKFEFVVIYGRRRVGKTALINQFIRDKRAIYFMGVESNNKQNLENFSASIFEYKTDDGSGMLFASFQNALEYVFKLAEQERIILAIDEYPYVARSSRSLASTIQLMIDKYHNDSKLMLILCGSSMSYMEDQVLSYKAPLYGRRTAQIKLLPFNFDET